MKNLRANGSNSTVFFAGILYEWFLDKKLVRSKKSFFMRKKLKFSRKKGDSQISLPHFQTPFSHSNKSFPRENNFHIKFFSCSAINTTRYIIYQHFFPSSSLPNMMKTLHHIKRESWSFILFILKTVAIQVLATNEKSLKRDNAILLCSSTVISWLKFHFSFWKSKNYHESSCSFFFTGYFNYQSLSYMFWLIM